METKKMIEAAISRLTSSQKFKLFVSENKRGFNSYESLISYYEDCYDGAEPTVSKIYNELLSAIEED